MSKIKVIGFRDTGFDMDGNHYEGRNIYFINDDILKGQGCTTGRMFLNNARFEDIKFTVPCIFDITYNRWGKPDHIEVSYSNDNKQE